MKLIKFFILMTFSNLAFAQGQLAGKHVYILHPGMESVWGSYMMVVENPTPGENVKASFDLMLPQNTEDWSPQQGIEKADISLKEDGGLFVQADFIRPQSLIVIGFKMSGNASGEAPMELKLPFDMTEFSIMALEGRMDIESEHLEYKGGVEFSGQKYDTWVARDKKAGEVISATISGLPEGRGNYKMLAGIFSALLVLATAVLALKSKPVSNDSEFEVVKV